MVKTFCPHLNSSNEVKSTPDIDLEYSVANISQDTFLYIGMLLNCIQWTVEQK